MDANRLIRLSVAGWALMLSWPLQSWILGAERLTTTIEHVASVQALPGAIATVLVALTGGPLLGFVISSVAHLTIHLRRGGSTQFDVPTSDGELRRFATALQRLLPMDEQLRSSVKALQCRPDDKPPTRRKAKRKTDELERYFNLLYHSGAPPSLVEHTTRRWTLYWMYANSICAVVMGSTLALFTSGSFLTRDWKAFDLLAGSLGVELLLALFVLGGALQLGEMRRQIREVAWTWLYREAGC